MKVENQTQIFFRGFENCHSQQKGDKYLMTLFFPFTSCGTNVVHDTEDFVYTNEVRGRTKNFFQKKSFSLYEILWNWKKLKNKNWEKTQSWKKMKNEIWKKWNWKKFFIFQFSKFFFAFQYLCEKWKTFFKFRHSWKTFFNFNFMKLKKIEKRLFWKTIFLKNVKLKNKKSDFLRPLNEVVMKTKDEYTITLLQFRCVYEDKYIVSYEHGLKPIERYTFRR